MEDAARDRMGDVMVCASPQCCCKWRESSLGVLVSDGREAWKASTALLQMVNCKPELETSPRRFAKVNETDS